MQLLITAIVRNVRNIDEAKETFILQITDDPIEYIAEGEIIKVKDMGESKED